MLVAPSPSSQVNGSFVYCHADALAGVLLVRSVSSSPTAAQKPVRGHETEFRPLVTAGCTCRFQLEAAPAGVLDAQHRAGIVDADAQRL